MRKFQGRSPTAWAFLIKLFFLPLCIRVCILSVCTELCPSNATNAQPISTLAASVEAPYLHLHPPLPAFKDVLSSCRLVVVCALITREKFQPYFRQAPPGTTHCIREHRTYVRQHRVCTGTRGSPVEYVCIYECLCTLCDVRMAYVGGCIKCSYLLLLLLLLFSH